MIYVFFKEVRILELGLEHLLFGQIKSYPERMGKRMVALILINTHLEKKHFALGWTLIAFFVQLSIIKTEVESFGNTIGNSKQNACPRSSCGLSRDGRQAAEL